MGKPFCFLHCVGGGRKASDWLLDIDVASTLGVERSTGPKSYRLFCLMCARDSYSDVIPGGGERLLFCNDCGGRVFVEAEDLQPFSWYAGAGGNTGYRVPHRQTLGALDGEPT